MSSAWFVLKNLVFTIEFAVIACFTVGVLGATNNCESRNETAAALNGHICQNPCETKSNCLSSVRKCICDGLCGKSCVRTLLRCKILKNPVNGKVHHGTSRRYNATVKYSCDEGYMLIGSDSRVCRGHGKWDKSAPVCKKIESIQTKSLVKPTSLGTTESLGIGVGFKEENPRTSAISSVTASSKTTEFSETTTISSSGTDFSKALDKISSEDQSTPGKIFIGAGVWDVYQKSNTEQSVSKLSVNTNVETLSKVSQEFVAGGTNKECLDPPTLENSLITGKNSKYVIGTEVEYKCNYGFFATPKKNGFRIITATRCIVDIERNLSYWTALNMICKKKSCSDPGDISHGSRIGYVFTVGDEVRYKCDEGYEMIGRPVIFCTPSAKWNKSPPKCQANRCPIPENVDNGFAKYDGVDYLSVASYACSKSYTLIGNKERTCLANKTWSGRVPTCQVVKCEPPEFLLRGRIEVGEGPIGVGYIITFHCNAGTILFGSSTSRCLDDGSWSFDMPECKATCVSRPIANGEVYVKGDTLDSDESTTDHDEEETVKCDEGYQVSNTNEISFDLQCINGRWSPVDECIPASCDMLEILEYRPSGSRFVNAPDTSMADHNVEITLKCRNSHVPISIDHYAMKCEFGEWKWLNNHLRCRPKPCIVSEEEVGGKIFKNVYVGKFVFHGEALNLKCRDNYEFMDDSVQVIQCQYGTFNPSNFPKCQPKMCAKFELENGFDVTEAVHETRKEIQCHNGYKVDGSSTIRCEFGSWMPLIPSCVKASSCSDSSCTEAGFNKKAEKELSDDFCTYYPSNHHNVYSDVNGGRIVKSALRIPSGTTVKSRCINKTFFKPESGSSLSTCIGGTWGSEKPLSCRAARDGDIITPFDAGYRGRFVHSADGTVFIWEGYPLKLICYIKNRVHFPVWGTNSSIKYQYSHEGSSSVYSIKEAASGNSGTYRCFKSDYEYSDIRVRVVERFSCPINIPWRSAGLRVEFDEALSSASFSCEDDYDLEGDASVSCNNDYLWESHNPPHCTRIHGCQKPNIEEDSPLIVSNMKDKYALGERISFSCIDNFKIQTQHQTIQCTLYGWNKDVPSCVQGCPKPNISSTSNLLINTNKAMYSVGERLVFSCKKNFKIQERYKMIFCLPSGWNNPIPSCIYDEEK